ncbi:RNA polymerase sigma factor [Blastococcus sp. SYSU DS0619]
MRPEPPGERAGPEASRFTALWEQYSSRVMAYALRHVDRDTAQEVVAETFLVAWRRLGDVPGDAMPWLLVVARNTLANQRRSGYRRAVLQGELERLQRVAEPAPSAEVPAVERAAVLAALTTLTAVEREALLLVAWDGLTAAQAARVAGCSTSAFSVRLFRARRRLQSAAGDRAAAASSLRPTTPSESHA